LRENDGSFDVVLTDVNMPGMTGVELAKQISQDWARISVLLMSGYEPEAAVLAELPSRYEFIYKPFTLAQLDTALATLISG